MYWQTIRVNYPNQWLIIEALKAHTDEKAQRHLEELAVIEQCTDSKIAVNTYQQLHKLYPNREFYFVHTSREQLNIIERQRLGVRKNHETITIF